jgi:hypothetical protein
MTTYVLYCGVLITFEEYKEIIANTITDTTIDLE